MTLIIRTATTPIGAPILDDPATIEDMVRAQGSIIPAGATAVGITISIITIDQTGLQYHTRNNGTEFRFNTRHTAVDPALRNPHLKSLDCLCTNHLVATRAKACAR